MGFIFSDQCPGRGLGFGGRWLLCLIEVIDAVPELSMPSGFFRFMIVYVFLAMKVDVIFLSTKEGSLHSTILGISGIFRNNSICIILQP